MSKGRITLTFHGSPCQSYSVAGKGDGGDEGSGTRSSLMWYTVHGMEKVQSDFVIWENVKNVMSKKHIHNFNKYLSDMNEAGYNSYYKILNSKDFGVPQNRERIFVVSIRKDIDKGFEFPAGYDTGIRLKDILEDQVDEKYYINTEKAAQLIRELDKKGILISDKIPCDSSIYKPSKKEIANCITARIDAVCEKVGNIYPHEGQNGNIYSINKNSPTLSAGIGNKGTGIGSCNSPKICIPCLTPDRLNKRQNGRRFKNNGDPSFTLTGQDKHGILQIGNIKDEKNFKNPQAGRIYSKKGISPTITTMQGGNLQPKILEKTICEQRSDEGLRFFKDDICGTLRTIDSCGDKRVLERTQMSN